MEISRLNFDESKKADLEKTRAVLDREVRQLQMQMNEMEQRSGSQQRKDSRESNPRAMFFKVS